MRNLIPEIKMRTELAIQIFNSLQGSVVNPIRMNYESSDIDVAIRSELDGRSVKVSDGLLGEFYHLCLDVKEKLGYDEDVDFYITGSSELNARSYVSEIEGKNHAIEINSGLFELLNDDEKRFIIGHELGHLINNDSLIKKLYSFVYPMNEENDNEAPIFLQKRIELFGHLSELEADRYGYMACDNLDACVKASFKMSSGLNFNDEDVSLEGLLDENDRRLDYFLNDSGQSEDGDHPVDPIRVKALELYATAKTQKALNEGMGQLLDLLQHFTLDEESDLLKDFVASAGLLMAYSDGKKDKAEEEYILTILGRFCIHPIKVLKTIEKGDVTKTFEETTEKILNSNPQKAEELLDYIVDVAMADGKLTDSEVDFIYDFGQKIGIGGGNITVLSAEKLQQDFIALASVLG